jgi:hypothetical protein
MFMLTFQWCLSLKAWWLHYKFKTLQGNLDLFIRKTSLAYLLMQQIRQEFLRTVPQSFSVLGAFSQVWRKIFTVLPKLKEMELSS